ncbi:helix-turn-helix transcriptional regulator [Candidatus Pacearchaeota archaeon]|nr:helix-turn-helix transcriptional regulator [Candidatus Pacearchaeota archaeon]
MELRIGDKMALIMEAKGISPKELAKNTGLTQSHISLIKNNKRNPSVENLVKIADALYCKTDVLLGR